MRIILANLLLAITTCATSAGDDKDSCKEFPSSPSSAKRDPPLNSVEGSPPRFRTAATRRTKGRLGNHIWAYHLALAAQKEFPELRWHISDQTYKELTRVFKRVRIPSTADLCGEEEFWQAFNAYLEFKGEQFYEERLGRKVSFPRESDGRKHIPKDLWQQYPMETDELIEYKDFFEGFRPEFDKECAYDWEVFNEDIADLKKEEYRWNRHLLVHPGYIKGNYSFALDPEVERIFFEDLVFKDFYVDKAQSLLHRVKEEHKEKVLKKRKKKAGKKLRKKLDNPVFVGVHCRRTDHILYEWRNSQSSVNYAYYLEAMDMFRNHFRNSTVIFIFVSDDMSWGVDKLGGRRNKHGDVYFVGNGDPGDPGSAGLDLCLLSQCNHTVMSRGTFSHLGASFAGGLKIHPDHFLQFRDSVLSSDLFFHDPFEKPLPRLNFEKERLSFPETGLMRG